MSRKPKTSNVINTNLGQHLALSVATHLARTQLVSDPFGVYDTQHMMESVDVIATALLRVTPLHAKDVATGEMYALNEAELQGARVTNGAQNLVLKDGRNLSSIAIKRADLRQAIAILKAVGIPGLRTRRNPADEQPSGSQPEDRVAKLCAKLGEIEALLRFPLSPPEVDRVNTLAIAVARSAPHGRVANLSMRLLSALHESHDGGDDEGVRMILARLRAAVEETAGSRSTEANHG